MTEGGVLPNAQHTIGSLSSDPAADLSGPFAAKKFCAISEFSSVKERYGC
jgi:hypothetical protein